ncbi:hypothetical protein Sjap_012020 [Stephania japonica]|uniref:Uncharacterized protein n=1 Tax=Stephania japonica TaxID=461633 RepID=A0AAP0JCL8_9MAGN
MIDVANEPIWKRCKKMTKLSTMLRLLTIKSNHHISDHAFNKILQVCKDMLPEDNCLVDSF